MLHSKKKQFGASFLVRKRVLLWKVIIFCLVCSVLLVWNRSISRQLPCLCSVLVLFWIEILKEVYISLLASLEKILT
jgi:hypothetical protein